MDVSKSFRTFAAQIRQTTPDAMTKMNYARRKRLNQVELLLQVIKEQLIEVRDQEQEEFENSDDMLKESVYGDIMRKAIDELDIIYSELSTLVESILNVRLL